MTFLTASRSTSMASALRTAGSEKQRMLGLHRGALAVDLGIGIGEVQRDEFGVAADRIDGLALAALFQAQQDVVFAPGCSSRNHTRRSG